MAKKKKEIKTAENVTAPIRSQIITETIEKNYMPYAMSVIVSRAIPEIDGLKPSHRKLLYTMYKMGLLTGPRTKSANIVGQTMKLNPHGDASIYETLVRLTRGNETLLHPLVDSKGSFGKQYSSEMKYAASRYTECKLDSFCAELFGGIDKNSVDMVDNYDGTLKEPVLLPTTFPNVLITPNTGIAVGMASNTCPFNLAEVCDGTVALLRHPNITLDKMMEIIKAPDFPGGGFIVYDKKQIATVYSTGVGSVRIRAKYRFDKENNCIEILQIPYSTSIESIMKKIIELIKDGKLREITDCRDEIDLNGFKLTLDLKRGTDPEKLMTKLFKITPLEDNFKCNFNILINSSPRTMGIIEILQEWIKFRMGCVRRELEFDLAKKNEKLHLLLGLGKILLDIDKAIRIIRRTEHESDVVPNLMDGFEIDQVQAEYIAEIKLRHLNREYILNRISEIEGLKAEIAELESILADEIKLKEYIAKQLIEIKKKYGQPRRSQIIGLEEIAEYNEEDLVESYKVRVSLTKEGYFKKITFQSLRGNDEHKFKDGDSLLCEFDVDNTSELMFFTDKAQIYRIKVNDFDTVKASSMGDFLPAKLSMDDGEKPIFMKEATTFGDNEYMVYIFKNGKGVKVPLASYETKSFRKKLTGAYSDTSEIVGIFYEAPKKPFEIMLINNADRAIVIKTSLVPVKTTRSSGGVSLMTLKKGQEIEEVLSDFEGKYDSKGYRKLKIPATGVLMQERDAIASQMKIE